MMTKRLGFVLAISLICAPLCAYAQGYPSGVRTGTSTGTSTSPISSGAVAAPAPTGSAPRNIGTGQGRTEGALGMSPQLQRELGIGRQQ